MEKPKVIFIFFIKSKKLLNYFVLFFFYRCLSKLIDYYFMTKVAETGLVVKVHYTGKLKDNSIFDSSEGRDPLEFKLGAGNMIPGFEKAVLGMQIGEEKTVNIPSEEAYGAVNENMIIEVPHADFNIGRKAEVGMQVSLQTANGNPIPAVVKEVKAETVVIDANHSLAGKDLIFEIKLVEINSEEDADKKPLLFD